MLMFFIVLLYMCHVRFAKYQKITKYITAGY